MGSLVRIGKVVPSGRLVIWTSLKLSPDLMGLPSGSTFRILTNDPVKDPLHVLPGKLSLIWCLPGLRFTITSFLKPSLTEEVGHHKICISCITLVIAISRLFCHKIVPTCSIMYSFGYFHNLQQRCLGRHIYNWNIFECDIKPQINQTNKQRCLDLYIHHNYILIWCFSTTENKVKWVCHTKLLLTK